jgi:hypothetical protein
MLLQETLARGEERIGAGHLRTPIPGQSGTRQRSLGEAVRREPSPWEDRPIVIPGSHTEQRDVGEPGVLGKPRNPSYAVRVAGSCLGGERLLLRHIDPCDGDVVLCRNRAAAGSHFSPRSPFHRSTWFSSISGHEPCWVPMAARHGSIRIRRKPVPPNCFGTVTGAND